MPLRFDFTDALWFRAPLRALALAVAVFGLIYLYPALTDPAMRMRGLLGLAVISLFVLAATLVTAAVADSYIELDGDVLFVRFEAVFSATFPLAGITSVRRIDPPRRWRHSFGLSTDWRDRIALSHGGPLMEIEFARPCPTRLLRRTVGVRRLWVAVRDPDALAVAIARAAGAAHPPKAAA